MHQVDIGVLERGAPAASGATLAKQLGVSPLDVEKAYEWLEACGALTRDSADGWTVAAAAGRRMKIADESDEVRLSKFVDETLRAAAEYGIDPAAFAEKTMRRVGSIRHRIGTRKLVFVGSQPEYVDDFVEVLRRELSDLDVKISGLLTSSTTGTLDRRRAATGTLAQAEYILTTVSQAAFVRDAVGDRRHRVIALSHAVNQEAVYKIVSLRPGVRLAAVFAPDDTGVPILRALEYYRDLPAGSIPYALATDARGLEKLLAECDVIAYTQACQGQKAAFQKPGRESILLRFVPDNEAIGKIRALLTASALEPASGPRGVAAK
jgi:DNA-binding transcriptional regulator YhcF (GntR family)